jgi:hypothetical protein
MSDRIAEIRARLDAATTLPVSPHSVTLFPIDRKRDEKAERAFIANAPADIAWLLDRLDYEREFHKRESAELRDALASAVADLEQERERHA